MYTSKALWIKFQQMLFLLRKFLKAGVFHSFIFTSDNNENELWSDPIFEPSECQPILNANQPTFDLVEQELKDLTTEFLNNWDFSQVKIDLKKATLETWQNSWYCFS